MTEVNLGHRMASLDVETACAVRAMLDLAPRGLSTAYLPETGEFAQTVRAVTTSEGVRVRAEGTNVRYAAMAALGLSRLDVEVQRGVLAGKTAAEVAQLAAEHALEGTDPGAVALAAWAEAEINATYADKLFGRMGELLASGAPLFTVETAWMVTAAAAAAGMADTDEVLDGAAARLIAHQGAHGIYPHRLPPSAEPRWRAHVGSFADQVYPLQAFARAGALRGDASWLARADRTAARLVELQGERGQWWWHYDCRDGSVVEPYPVYSVHQHAMAPMVLHDLREAGGADHTAAVTRGARWLQDHPEVVEELVSTRWGLVWRKVGRREPPKAARALQAAASTLRKGTRLPGVDTMMPPVVVDHECRPYELGWMLYAWLPAEAAQETPVMTALVPLSTEDTATEVLFGLDVAAITLDDTIRMADEAVSGRRRLLVGVVNAAKIVKLKADAVLRDSLLEADVILADGMAVVWASKVLGRPLPERVAGIDLFESLLGLGDAKGYSVYLFGAKQEVIDRVCEVVAERWPGVKIAGSRNGYFAPEESAGIAADIAASGADMLFLGITTPHKEIFLGQYADTMGVPVMHGVGGSFDVMAGVTKRAPQRWQRWGMEWFYRVVQEPRRLWRRYLVTNTLFVALLVVERIRRRPRYR